MKLLSVFALLWSMNSLSVTGQISHSLEIFSEDGLNFTLLINGQKINESPQAGVKIKDIENDFVQVKILFEDETLPEVSKKNLQIATPGTEPVKPVSTVYKIIEKKGQYKLRFVSRSDKMIQNEVIIITH